MYKVKGVRWISVVIYWMSDIVNDKSSMNTVNCVLMIPKHLGFSKINSNLCWKCSRWLLDCTLHSVETFDCLITDNYMQKRNHLRKIPCKKYTVLLVYSGFFIKFSKRRDNSWKIYCLSLQLWIVYTVFMVFIGYVCFESLSGINQSQCIYGLKNVHQLTFLLCCVYIEVVHCIEREMVNYESVQ